MARSAPSLSSFVAGEISPRLEGRTELEKYKAGASELLNMIVHPHGGVTRRPGTEFLGEVKDSATKTRLIPFQFKTSDTYILEFGDSIMRVYRNGGQVLDATKNITGATQANPVVITSAAHGYSNGDEVFITGVTGMTQLNSRNYKVANKTTDTFEITDLYGNNINGTAFTAYTSTIGVSSVSGAFTVGETVTGGTSGATALYVSDDGTTMNLTGVSGVFQSGETLTGGTSTETATTTSADTSTSGGTSAKIFEVASPYPATKIFDVKFVQSADTMYLVHPEYAVRTLTRTDHNVWTFATPEFIDGPYLDLNTTTTTVNPAATTGTGIALVASANLFASTDVGRLIALHGGYAEIASFTDAQNVTIDIKSNFTASTATVNWELGAWSDTTGYPSCVTFFEQRLVFAATTEEPQTMFFSKNGDYLNFTSGTNADDALIYQIASNQVNNIRYLSATRVLTIGTSGGEYVLTTTNDGPVTPTNAQIRKYSNYGTASVEPVQVADVTMFLQRAKRKLREFKYAGEINTSGYIATDLTILAEHITEGGMLGMAYQQEPDSIVWMIRNDGQLIGLTYRREEEVVAWHRHTIGGTYTGTHENLASATYAYGMVESIATLPSDSGEDELYMIVKRTINSVTKRYVERMKTFDFGNDTTEAFFVDSGLTYSGAATTSFGGLYHLNGETVASLVNGATHPDKTVAAGSITLDTSATNAAVGLAYTSRIKTLRLEAGSADGTSQGKIKRIHSITLRLHETVGVEVGSSTNEVDRIPFRTSAMAMSAAVELFTGDKEIEFRGGFEEDEQIVVQQSQPLPLTLLAIYPRLNTFDK